MHRGKLKSDFTKGQVVALKQDGKSIREISRRLKLPNVNSIGHLEEIREVWKYQQQATFR